MSGRTHIGRVKVDGQTSIADCNEDVDSPLYLRLLTLYIIYIIVFVW